MTSLRLARDFSSPPPWVSSEGGKCWLKYRSNIGSFLQFPKRALLLPEVRLWSGRALHTCADIYPGDYISPTHCISCMTHTLEITYDVNTWLDITYDYFRLNHVTWRMTHTWFDIKYVWFIVCNTSWLQTYEPESWWIHRHMTYEYTGS
jgi:hypothetical protein